MSQKTLCSGPDYNTSLLAIRDAYPKFVVTMDTRFQDSIEGIRYISLLQFLTDVYLF